MVALIWLRTRFGAIFSYVYIAGGGVNYYLVHSRSCLSSWDCRARWPEATPSWIRFRTMGLIRAEFLSFPPFSRSSWLFFCPFYKMVVWSVGAWGSHWFWSCPFIIWDEIDLWVWFLCHNWVGHWQGLNSQQGNGIWVRYFPVRFCVILVAYQAIV